MSENLTEQNPKQNTKTTKHGVHKDQRFRWWLGTAYPKNEDMKDDEVFRPNIGGRWYKCWWERGEESNKIHSHFLVYSDNLLTKGDKLCEDERFKHINWTRVLTSCVETVSNYSKYKIKPDGTKVEKKHIKTFTANTDAPKAITQEMKYMVKKAIVNGDTAILNCLSEDDKAAIGGENLKKWFEAERIFANAAIDLNEARKAFIEIRYGESGGGKSYGFQTDPSVCVMDQTSLREGGDLWFGTAKFYKNPKTFVLNEFGCKKLRITNALSLVDNTASVRPVKGDEIKIDCRHLVYITNDPITLFFDYAEEGSKCVAFGKRIKSVKCYYQEWSEEDPDTFVEVEDLYKTFLKEVKALYENTKDQNKDVHFEKIRDKYEIAVQKRIQSAKLEKRLNKRSVKIDDDDNSDNEINLDKCEVYKHSLSDINKVFSLK